MKVFSIAVLATFVVGLLFSSDASARNIGIYLCPDCDLETPFPDDDTRTEILLHQWNWNNAHPKEAWMVEGDVIILCNGSICVPYTRNADGTYMGGTAVEQRPPAGAGPGGGAGGGGGTTPPGGLGGRLVCGYVNGQLDHCQFVYEYIA